MFSDLASCFCFGANNYGLDFCLSSKRLDMALIFGFGEGVGNIWFGLGLYFCNTYQSGCWFIAINKWFGLYCQPQAKAMAKVMPGRLYIYTK